MVQWFEKLKNRTPLGWLQLSHEKGRLLVALAGVAFADVLMFMQLGFQAALYNSATRLHENLIADLVLLSPQARNLNDMSDFPRRRIYQAMDVPGVTNAESLYVNFVDWKNPQTRKQTAVLAVGFDPANPAFSLPEVNEHLSEIRLPERVLFDRASRGEYDQVVAQVDGGESVETEVDGRTIKIVGLFKIGASFGADGTIITSDQNFLRLFPNRNAGNISVGLLDLDPQSDPEAVARALNNYLPEDVYALTKAEFIEFEQNYWQNNTAIGFIFNLGVTMGFVVGVIIVYQVLSTDVNAHLSEYATFKAIGYRNRYFLGVIFEEALILAFLGFIPGIAVSFGLYRLTRQATNLPLYLTLVRAITVFLLTAIMCSISGAIATRKLQAADPADIF